MSKNTTALIIIFIQFILILILGYFCYFYLSCYKLERVSAAPSFKRIYYTQVVECLSNKECRKNFLKKEQVIRINGYQYYMNLSESDYIAKNNDFWLFDFDHSFLKAEWRSENFYANKVALDFDQKFISVNLLKCLKNDDCQNSFEHAKTESEINSILLKFN